MTNKPIRVGFDMDGVLLYNPFRIVRPIMAFIKKYILKRKTTKFYLPKSSAEQFIWTVIHKSSVFQADGINDIHRLVKEGKIEAYVVTSRFSGLKKDVEYWFNKINKENTFTQCFYNDGDEQPHMYKEKMIRDLHLEYFVEDNWDIIQHVNENLHKNHVKTKVLWIYNIIDKRIPYEYKFPNLKEAVKHIENNLK